MSNEDADISDEEEDEGSELSDEDSIEENPNDTAEHENEGDDHEGDEAAETDEEEDEVSEVDQSKNDSISKVVDNSTTLIIENRDDDTMVLKTPKLARFLMLLRTGQFSDCDLCDVHGSLYKLHRAILAARSGFFKAAFT